jgi:hypothetical protein
MYKLNSVLRSLVLVFLSSWIGIAVQQAEAQSPAGPFCHSRENQNPSPRPLDTGARPT